MTRLTQRFAALKEHGEKALIVYVTVGDPSPERTVEIALALDRAGVDVIELGIPFSDPLADGPSIQSASFRALQNGVNVARVLETVRAIRKRSEIPLLLFTYYNPVFRYGVERFARDAAESGADAGLLVDLTPEEAQEWIAAARANSLDTIFLIAPTSTDARIEVVSRLCTGFIYCVSRTGVTGARDDVPPDVVEMVARVRARSPLPISVGFGISRPEHVRSVGAYADGVVVGSAMVNLIAQHGDTPDVAEAARAFAESLKAAARQERIGPPL
jgi:tryptophan synthase alpha chain